YRILVKDYYEYDDIKDNYKML
ncbi:hypothetical protein LCGC14_2440080, partial [marine sediment metagenome]